MSPRCSSSLGRVQAREPTSPLKIRALGVDAWRSGILVIRIDDVRDDFERQVLKNVGNRLYGEKS